MLSNGRKVLIQTLIDRMVEDEVEIKVCLLIREVLNFAIGDNLDELKKRFKAILEG